MSLGFFGGREISTYVETKAERLNIFEEYKKVLEGTPMNPEAIVPLMKWFSNHKNNIEKIQSSNKNFFFVNKDILARFIFLNIDRRIRFIKYPKTIKEEDKFDFLIPYVCKFYSWSERDYEHYKQFINLDNVELHNELNKAYGFSDEELRKLGLKREKSKEKYDGRKIKGFF